MFVVLAENMEKSPKNQKSKVQIQPKNFKFGGFNKKNATRMVLSQPSQIKLCKGCKNELAIQTYDMCDGCYQDRKIRIEKSKSELKESIQTVEDAYYQKSVTCGTAFGIKKLLSSRNYRNPKVIQLNKFIQEFEAYRKEQGYETPFRKMLDTVIADCKDWKAIEPKVRKVKSVYNDRDMTAVKNLKTQWKFKQGAEPEEVTLCELLTHFANRSSALNLAIQNNLGEALYKMIVV